MVDWIEHFRVAANGLPVSHVWHGHGSTLFVEIGRLSPTTRRDGTPGHVEGEVSLMIGGSWRIENKQSIICGSCSDEALWETAFVRLRGQRVNDIKIFGRLPEMHLFLSGGSFVASFMTSEGDPDWKLYDKRGASMIIVGCQSGVVTKRD